MNTEKVVLVTGASSGMGYSGAQQLVDAGFVVYATSDTLDGMSPLQERGAKVRALDVTDEAMMVACVDEIVAEEGRIDVLINNAGYGSYGALEDVAMSEARRQFDVNVFGLARLTQLVLPHMRARQSGTIVNISSVGGVTSEPHGAWYHATKFAVEGLSDCLRQEVSQFGINVVVVLPGAVHSNWSSLACEFLLNASGGTAYGDLAQKHASFLERIHEGASDPSVIGKAMVEICEASKPKTRYARGKHARTALIMRRLLSDRMYDRFILSLLRRR